MSWLGPLTPPESEVAMVSWEGRNPATMEAPRNVKPENAGQLEIYEARS